MSYWLKETIFEKLVMFPSTDDMELTLLRPTGGVNCIREDCSSLCLLSGKRHCPKLCLLMITWAWKLMSLIIVSSPTLSRFQPLFGLATFLRFIFILSSCILGLSKLRLLRGFSTDIPCTFPCEPHPNRMSGCYTVYGKEAPLLNLANN